MIFSSEQLALQPQGSALHWNVFDDGLISGDYRIRCLRPDVWDVTYRGASITTDRNLTAAFVTAERHHRKDSRNHLLRRNRNALIACALAWMAVDMVVRSTGAVWVLVAMLPIVYIGFSSAAGMLLAFGGDTAVRHRKQR